MGAHVHLGDEDLLELALRGRDAGDCAACSLRLEELRSFAELCRDALAPELAGSAAPAPLPLVERVLAATTRELPGVRGDLALVGRFVRERLRSSFVLRAAAAALLAHLLALPVLAWFAFRDPPVQSRIRFVLPPEDPFLPEVDEALGPLDPVEEPELPLQPSSGAAYLAASRAALLAADAPVPDEARQVDWDSAGLLEARARVIAGRGLPPALATPPPPGTGLLERALHTELLLDLLALRGEVPAGFAAALEGLGASVAGAPDGPERTLAFLALGRASASGTLGSLHVAAGERQADPLDREWRGALRRALLARGSVAADAGRAWTSP